MENSILEILNTSLFSIDQRLKIVEWIKNKELSQDDIDKILDLIHNFNDWVNIAVNRYYRNMDNVYKQYLDKNISLLKQWMIKIKIKTNEVKTYETEWDADLLLDQI